MYTNNMSSFLDYKSLGSTLKDLDSEVLKRVPRIFMLTSALVILIQVVLELLTMD